MPVRVYTKEQLLALRNSPLVCKPENLPAIEAWIDESQQQSQSQKQDGARRAQPRMPSGGEAFHMGSFGTGSRPALMQVRSHVSRSGEEISLGPPKALFPSSRSVPRLADFAEKTNEANHAEDTEATRHSRGFGEKQASRKSLNANEPETRHSKDSWTQARDRRAQGGDEESGERRFGRREREQEGERRNGYGEKTDGRWGAHREEKRPNGDRTGGWRERERQKHDRDRDRDWERSGKDPEWMEDPVNQQDEDLSTMGMPKNQEDFEKWKQAQHARTKRPTDDAALKVSEALPSAPLEITAPAKKVEPLKLDSLADKAFGGWGENRRTEPVTEGPQPTVLTQPPAKGKSRFMPMFQKDKPREQVAAVETLPQASMGSEDDNKAGFDRILQMLSTTGISQAATPAELPSTQSSISREPVSPPQQSQSIANGQRPKSRFTGFFDQTPKSPDRMQSPHVTESQPANRQRESEIYNDSHHFARDSRTNFGLGSPDDFVRQRMENNLAQGPKVSSDPPPSDGRKEQPPQQTRVQDLFLEPPSRAASTPDNNIQNLLAQRNKGQQGQDKNSDFLLSLLQAKGNARPASSQAHPDFPLWIDQAKINTSEPHAPKPMIHAKAGMFEDQILRHGPPEMLRQDQQQASTHETINQRRTAQRAPPGFFDEQTLFLQQQQQQQGQPPRRSFPEPPQQQGPPPGRRAAGFPGQQMQMSQVAPQYPPQDYMQSAPGLHAGPPPGFNPHMRHPPGFHNIPNIFEAPQPQQQKPRQSVPPPPANFGGAMMMPGQGPLLPNVPPGFFAGPPAMPPGFMPMRQPEGLPAAVRGNGRGAPDGFDAGGQRR